MAEYNIDEYNVEGDGNQYNFKICLVEDKINLQLTQLTSEGYGKNYEGEFTLEELRQVNRVFHLTPTIYDAQEEFKKAIERQKIALSENEAYVNILFHMILGTDNSPFVIALPRNESARIMKLEQDSDMLKLERDNLFEKLELIKRNTNEILQSTVELEEENKKLKDMTNNIEEEMSNSAPIKPINPIETINMKPFYNNEVDNMKKIIINPNYNNNMNRNMDQNRNSMNNMLPKGSNQFNYGQNMNKNISYHKPNKSIQYQNQNSEIQQLLEQKIRSKPQKTNINSKIFPCGILFNIIKNEKEIENVTQRIQGYLNKKIHYSLLYCAKDEGDKASTFHQKCDKAKSSLVLIMDSFGNRFGGFTMRDWRGICIKKKDENAFIFSIDKNKIYGVLPDKDAIGCYPTFGPIFFGCQIRVYDNFFTKGGSTYLKGLNYATEEDYELTNGNQVYGIKELEVYEVK